MALPHFSQILSANGNHEPIYKALFEITFDTPALIGSTTEEVQLLLENATSISLPVTPPIEVKSQNFKFSTRAYVTLPTQTHLTDIKIKFNLNENKQNNVFVWSQMKKWYDLAWNSQTGETHVKEDMLGSIIVNVHNKKGQVIRRVTYRNVQIVEVQGWDFDFANTTDILECEVSFIADYWEDLYKN